MAAQYIVKVPCKISGQDCEPGDIVSAATIGPGAHAMVSQHMIELYAPPRRIEETSNDHTKTGREGGPEGGSRGRNGRE